MMRINFIPAGLVHPVEGAVQASTPDEVQPGAVAAVVDPVCDVPLDLRVRIPLRLLGLDRIYRPWSNETVFRRRPTDPQRAQRTTADTAARAGDSIVQAGSIQQDGATRGVIPAANLALLADVAARKVSHEGVHERRIAPIIRHMRPPGPYDVVARPGLGASRPSPQREPSAMRNDMPPPVSTRRAKSRMSIASQGPMTLAGVPPAENGCADRLAMPNRLNPAWHRHMMDSLLFEIQCGEQLGAATTQVTNLATFQRLLGAGGTRTQGPWDTIRSLGFHVQAQPLAALGRRITALPADERVTAIDMFHRAVMDLPPRYRGGLLDLARDVLGEVHRAGVSRAQAGPESNRLK